MSEAKEERLLHTAGRRGRGAGSGARGAGGGARGAGGGARGAGHGADLWAGVGRERSPV